jgi:hypothetical protein
MARSRSISRPIRATVALRVSIACSFCHHYNNILCTTCKGLSLFFFTNCTNAIILAFMDIHTLISDLATEKGITPGALRKWRERGFVPPKWRLPLMEAAQDSGHYIPPTAFDEFGLQPAEAT